jgi:N-hydroxyarylamine O-acetyltransferase
MDIQTYLDRINYHGPLAPTADTLRQLHLAHLLTVPFENLDIHLGRPIILDASRLFEKIVLNRRGGFCYELNGLFAGLLRALGFQVELLAAGVSTERGAFGPPFDHLTLMVKLEQRWLADVGFGDSFRESLLLDSRDEQLQAHGRYRLVAEGEHLIYQQREGDAWKPQYQFTLQPYQLADYTTMCHYHQTSPQSSFTRRRVCSRATPTGRVTLADMTLITTANGARTERPVSNQAEYEQLLREQFGVVLPEGLRT